ncbi:diguanylate cyclase [Cohnella sp. WQ 127256]|uniref:diguanylate cyclase n=1 Tax=Cohnella sp. WQ 127256 TaxID=2938790 RepID=UPI002117630B|nr:diguanylate cyclase [Cohnella sp. WQ 127256]
MSIHKYKALLEQRIKMTFQEWSIRASVEEREVYRFLHNLKGTAGTIGMKELERVAEQKLQLYSDEGFRELNHSEWKEELHSLLAFVPDISEESTQPDNTFLVIQPEESSSIKENKILIIDDDAELAAYLKGILEERSYSVNIALTAERGLKLFYDWKPDMLILDLFLPDRNGLQVLKQILEKFNQAHIPIIVISIKDSTENKIHAYRLGAMDFFSKPIDSELLGALIDNRFRMKRHWEHSIVVDELTGAYNRKHFNRVMKHLISHYQRSQSLFSIVMMDLDYFKRVNDSYGHLKGDEVLQCFTQVVQEAKREEDVFCRYGGEEFALLLPNTDKHQAKELMERIHKQLSLRVFESDSQTFQVTFTAGITDITEDNSHIEKMVGEADQALYLGKQSGRNRTLIFSPHMAGNSMGHRLNILIVDDDPLIRDVVVSQFVRWQPIKNMTVCVKDYVDGIEFLNSDWYSEQEKYIILLDGSMPTIDGLEVLDRIRSNYPERNIIVAMLTARANQADIVHALQNGADDYIVKPFQMPELMSRVERLAHRVIQ